MNERPLEVNERAVEVNDRVEGENDRMVEVNGQMEENVAERVRRSRSLNEVNERVRQTR